MPRPPAPRDRPTPFVLIAIVLALPGAAAMAQSFNIDLDVTVGFPSPAAMGAPSSGFGAAAAQVGFWNAADTQLTTPIPLNSLSNTPTGAMLQMSTNAPNGFAHWSYPNVSNTGDFAKLLNDCHIVNNNPGPWSNAYKFSGLLPGTYQVYTYGARPLTGPSSTRVNVTGGSGPMIIAGPMPGNAFALGITHCIDTVTVTGGALSIVVDRGFSSTQAGAYISGFQLVRTAPAPGGLAVVGAAGLIAMRRRRAK